MKKVSIGLIILTAIYSFSMLHFRASVADSLIVLFLGALACALFYIETKSKLVEVKQKEPSEFEKLQQQYELQKLQYQIEEHKIAMSRRLMSQDANPEKKVIW